MNYTNAQNLNCLALAKHLDKSKYDVRTIVGYSGNLPIEKIAGVKYYKMHYPARIWNSICLCLGLLWCDVAYLPTPMRWRLCARLVKWLKKPAFQTVEGVYQGIAIERALATFGDLSTLCRFMAYTGHVYSITESMKAENERVTSVRTNEKVLYLGVEAIYFINEVQRTCLTDVLLIGADLERKGLPDYLMLAKDFPTVKFHIAGGGVGNLNATEEISKLGLLNAVYHGKLTHSELRELLKTVQLHIFPSRAEGFPKVTLECAAAGVPSLVYDDYGADEWITTGKDGFVVKTLDEMRAVVQDLLAHPEKLPSLATNARVLAQRFDWSVLVKDWENVIDELTSQKAR